MVAHYEEARVFEIGAVFRDHYVVTRFIGSGASGQVYEVQHRHTQARLALKVDHGEERADARKQTRALMAGRATYWVQHRNVVRIVEIGLEADGMVWQLMELLEGVTLATLLRRFGKLPPVYAIDLIIEACHGLQAVHEHLIIHRDVQPSNLFLTYDGEVKVLDFGEAKVIPAGTLSTQGRPAPGTTGYMSPEQQAGATPAPHFDVYALAVTLWQCLAGQHPFQGPRDGLLAVVKKRRMGLPSLVEAAGLPAYCDEVLRRATAADLRTRYEGMWAFAEALGNLRERLLRDPQVATLVQRAPGREGALPAFRHGDGWQQYGPPRALPRESPSPSFPSRRVVVPVSPTLPDPEPEERRSSGVVAKTISMAQVPPSPARPAPGDALPPTVRAPRQHRRSPAAMAEVPRSPAQPVAPGDLPPRPSRRWLWGALAVTVVLAGVALGLALGVTGVALDALDAGAPTSSARVPAAPASSARRR